ncbi:MAG: ABC transporter ATP-binding protein [Kiritimatiellae bacterium]|nr:ABC transporter ATP-binding protein [Kiritimatiellia bacterium]
MKAKGTLKKHFKRTRFLAKTLASSPAVLFIYTPLAVAQTAAGVAVPFATGRFIDALVGCAARENARPPAAGGTTVALAAFAVLAALMLARTALAPILQRLVLARARDVELKLQNKIVAAVVRFHPARLAVIPDGELVAKLLRDASAAAGFVRGLYPRLLAALATMFAAAAALYSRSAALAVAFAVFIPFAIIAFAPFARRFAASSRDVRMKSDGAFSALFDFFRSLTFLRTLDAAGRFAGTPCDALAALKERNSSLDSLAVAFGAFLGALLAVGEVAVLGVAGAFAAKGEIPVGDVVAYQMLFLAAAQSIQSVIALLPEAASLRESVDSLCEVLSREPADGGEKPGAVETLEFRNVSFAWPGAGRPVVKDFSAVFRAGRIYALAGANGAGKTTLLKLASNALKPQEGDVFVNGKPVESLDDAAFRRSFGIVFQDSLLVTGTVRDNITLRDTTFTGYEIKKAIAASGLEDVVKRLPDGLDTRLGLQGQSLSGGEMQRLAVARALIRDPDVLVLDEATNHLDAAARKAFAEMLRKLAKNRIVLVVSHDESIMDLCDEKIFCQIPQ